MVARLGVGATDWQAEEVVIGVGRAKLTSNPLQEVIVVDRCQCCALICNVLESVCAESTTKHVICLNLGQSWCRTHAFLVVPAAHALSTDSSEVSLASGAYPVNVGEVRWSEAAMQLAANFDVCLWFLF